MRPDKPKPPESETEPDQSAATATAASDEPDPYIEDPAVESLAPAIPASPPGGLWQAMKLKEPERSDRLELFVQSGEQFYLKTTDGSLIRQRHGRAVLKVGPEPRAFSAAHAIHILWYHNRPANDEIGLAEVVKVVEVPEEEI